MIKKILLICVVFIITQPVFADGFAGHWVAESGQLTMSGGTLKLPCSHIEIIMEQQGDTLTNKKYSAKCQLVDTSWGPDVMTIKGEKVFDQGEEIGTLKDGTLITVQPINGFNYAFNLKLINGGEALESYYGSQNDVGAIVIEGTLHRAP